MASTYIRLPVAIVNVSNFPVSVEIANDVGNPVPVTGTLAVTGALTDAELRASPVDVQAINFDIRDLDFFQDSVDVSGSVVALDAATLAALETITIAGTVSVTGPLTDTELRAAPVAVYAQGSLGTLTDRSGTATVTSSQIMPANSLRKFILLQNHSNVTLWFNFTAAATTAAPSIQLPQNGTFVMQGNFISTEAVNIIAPSGSRSYTAKEG